MSTKALKKLSPKIEIRCPGKEDHVQAFPFTKKACLQKQLGLIPISIGALMKEKPFTLYGPQHVFMEFLHNISIG